MEGSISKPKSILKFLSFETCNCIFIKNERNSGNFLSILLSCFHILVIFSLVLGLIIFYILGLPLCFKTTAINFSAHMHQKCVIIFLKVIIHEWLSIIGQVLEWC